MTFSHLPFSSFHLKIAWQQYLQLGLHWLVIFRAILLVNYACLYYATDGDAGTECLK